MVLSSCLLIPSVCLKRLLCVWRNRHRENWAVVCPGRRLYINHLRWNFLIICLSTSLSRRIMRTDITLNKYGGCGGCFDLLNDEHLVPRKSFFLIKKFLFHAPFLCRAGSYSTKPRALHRRLQLAFVSLLWLSPLSSVPRPGKAFIWALNDGSHFR